MSEIVVCPLCGSGPTHFTNPLSDEGLERSFRFQRCSNNDCELPCSLWWLIAAQMSEVERMRAECVVAAAKLNGRDDRLIEACRLIDEARLYELSTDWYDDVKQLLKGKPCPSGT